VEASYKLCYEIHGSELVNHDDVNPKQQIKVSWTLPLSGWVKINSDGVCPYAL